MYAQRNHCLARRGSTENDERSPLGDPFVSAQSEYNATDMALDLASMQQQQQAVRQQSVAQRTSFRLVPISLS